MKTLIKKEIRLLVPAWIAAMLLAIAPAWLIEYFLPHQNAVIYVPPPFFILPGLLLLGISAFGREFSAKTFSLLLSQPVVRGRAWRLKILMLALAFVVVLAAQTISWSLFIQLHPAYSSHFLDPFPGLWLWAVALFAGGLWTTLLLRQEIGALWITLMVPAAILTGVGTLGDYLKFSEKLDDRLGDLAVLVYSVAGFLFARHLFLRAQDAQWTGGTVFFWRGRRNEHARSFVFGPTHNRFLALLWKEIQLHEASLFISAIILVLNLASLAVRPFITNFNLKSVLEFVWAVWLLIPLLIGCSAVAEERRLGVAEAQLCQPVSRRIALCIKFLVGLVLSVILGAVMPSLIEWSLNFGITDWPHFWIFIAAPTIFFISFYASTLSRSTAHAIGVAIAVSVVGFSGFIAFVAAVFHANVETSGFSTEDYEMSAGFGRLYLLIGFCLLIFPLVLARLMYLNYKWLHTGWRMFRFNVSAILISFTAIFILTNAIYYRSWELFSSVNTPRGPVRLTLQSPVKFSFCPAHGGSMMVALLPDGRLWQQEIDNHPINYRTEYWTRQEPRRNMHRYVGSNWEEVSANEFHILGIQKNGSLWRIPGFGSKRPLTQIGSDTDWFKVAGNEDGFLLLKKDGTLWFWGTNQTANIDEKIRQDLVAEPSRIDPGTNWTDLIPFGYFISLAQRNDGTFWSWRNLIFKDGSGSSLHLVREENLDNQWTGYLYNYNFPVEVKTNGQLWLYYQRDTNWNNSAPKGGFWEWQGVPRYTKKIQLGSDSDWKAVEFGAFDSLILLRKDGTLWKWKDPWQKPFHPVQLGKQSDWIALDSRSGIALAADGSLWSWNDPSDHVLLAPSRKPVYMGNIFEGVETGSQPTTKTDAP